MNCAPRATQKRCLSTTCSARSRKYGIQPISPSDSAIFRLGNRGEVAAEDPRQHRAGGADRTPRQVGHERRVRGDLGHVGRRADVHRDHQAQLVRGREDRVPVAVLVMDRRQPELGRLLREREGRHALGRHPVHLLDRELRVPHRDQHQRDVAAGRRTAPILDHPVVPRLQAGEAEFAVTRLHEQLPAEPRQRREAQRREDAGLVHVLDPGLRVVTARPHLGVRHRLRTEFLLGLAGHRRQAARRESLAVVDPDLAAIFDHVRRPVAILGRHPVDPEVRWLEDVVVHRDEPVQIELCSHLFLR